MTHAFDTFLRQFHMTGREKLDGYSPAAFDGLSDEERHIVVDMMATELPWAADWLFRLDPARAFAAAREVEPRVRGSWVTPAMQREMVKYSGDLTYQRHMIEDYAHADPATRRALVDALAGTPATRAALDFLKQAFCTDADWFVACNAAHALMLLLGLSRTTAPGQELYDAARDAARAQDAAARHAVLQRLEPFERAWQERPATQDDSTPGTR